MTRGAALHGGMPLYKFVGNKCLSWFENRCLRTQLTEFHSGYRVYSVAALNKVRFDLNSNDFHFDTEIIIQFVIARLRIVERPIPTYYGDEICHVNGLAYAWNVIESSFVGTRPGIVTAGAPEPPCHRLMRDYFMASTRFVLSVQFN